MQGTIDGSRQATFIIDTGGEVISISEASANALGKREQARKIQLRVYGSSGWDQNAFLLPGVNLAFDAIQYRNFSVVVLNLDTPSALLGFQVGGIVGHRFLSNYGSASTSSAACCDSRNWLKAQVLGLSRLRPSLKPEPVLEPFRRGAPGLPRRCVDPRRSRRAAAAPATRPPSCEIATNVR